MSMVILARERTRSTELTVTRIGLFAGDVFAKEGGGEVLPVPDGEVVQAAILMAMRIRVEKMAIAANPFGGFTYRICDLLYH